MPPITRHHAEWQNLVEIAGPFLSMSVLERAFPQGLDAGDDEPALRRRLRVALEEWQDEDTGGRRDAALHRRFVRFVIDEVLGWPAEVIAEGPAIPPNLRVVLPQHHAALAPDLAVIQPEGRADSRRPRVLMQAWPPGTRLDRATTDRTWTASPLARHVELLRGARVELGLLTNGEDWMLVHAPRLDTTGTCAFQASLWLDEPLTLRAFRSLLGTRRLFGVPDDATLEALYTQSADDQQEVTDQLGLQVRHAVEILIQAIDRIDRERGGSLLSGVSERELYQAGVTVMMRLVFLLTSEARGLLMLGDPEYDDAYAASTLHEQLRKAADDHGDDVLERSFTAWSRLLATFRAIHGGVVHEDMSLPAHGGSLFDPDAFPFLEGRSRGTRWQDTPADPLPIHDRTVLLLLEALEFLEVKTAGGGPPERQRLSFRALGVDQIGNVYERLLDHAAVRASEPVLGLSGTKSREPEMSLSELEAAREAGEPKLLEVVAEATGRQESTVKRRLQYEIPANDPRWMTSCGNDGALLQRVRPFAGLVREDATGYPVVITSGTAYVTAGSDRRQSGTHYTPPSLTEPIVRHALEPLVFEGSAEGRPEAEWTLRTPKELLALRVCDPAMGSGAFLVQACLYLAERLVEAWARAEDAAGGGLVITPEGEPATGAPGEQLIPRDAQERLVLARRLIADRCLYGVDVNPMATGIAKMSLWITTQQKGRPFTFLDHALRAGDSLLGLTRLEQIEQMDPDAATTGYASSVTADFVRPAVRSALEKRRKLESFTVRTIEDVHAKEALLAQANSAVADVRQIAHLVVGASLAARALDDERLARLLEPWAHLLGAIDSSDDDDVRLHSAAAHAMAARAGARRREAELLDALRRQVGVMADQEQPDDVRSDLRGALTSLAWELLEAGREQGQPLRTPFHWVVEFPEVLADEGGFSALVGNPPFVGGQRITGALGTDYRSWLVEHLAGGRRGSADLCAYFFLRGETLLREGGMQAYLATNTIAQGDTREVGLEHMVGGGWSIPRAVPSRKWPGEANLEVAEIWMRKGPWKGAHRLDEIVVSGISPYLTVPSRVTGTPFRLKANEGKAFQGSIVLGMGFVMTPEEAEELIARDPQNRDVLSPYLNGEDLNSRPDQSASRWVINFRDWPLDHGSAPPGYKGPVAADYPLCLEIVRAKVKPERDRLASGNATDVDRARRWWQFGRPTRALYAALTGMPKSLARSQVSKFHIMSVVTPGHVFDQRLVCFAENDDPGLVQLSCVFHEVWSLAHGASLEARPVYTPGDCYETFPFAPCLQQPVLTRDILHTRAQACRVHASGLTKIYNTFHLDSDRSADMVRLRDLHVEMDLAVRDAYGWSDMAFDHDFHVTKQGTRFTISGAARSEVLDRLLELNHQRHAEEVAAGLHDKAKPKSKPRAARARSSSPTPTPQVGLFDAPDSPTLSADATTLLTALRASREPLSKSDVLAATHLPDSSWRPALTELLSASLITQHGTRRAARYSAT